MPQVTYAYRGKQYTAEYDGDLPDSDTLIAAAEEHDRSSGAFGGGPPLRAEAPPEPPFAYDPSMAEPPAPKRELSELFTTAAAAEPTLGDYGEAVQSVIQAPFQAIDYPFSKLAQVGAPPGYKEHSFGQMVRAAAEPGIAELAKTRFPGPGGTTVPLGEEGQARARGFMGAAAEMATPSSAVPFSLGKAGPLLFAPGMLKGVKDKIGAAREAEERGDHIAAESLRGEAAFAGLALGAMTAHAATSLRKGNAKPAVNEILEREAKAKAPEPDVPPEARAAAQAAEIDAAFRASSGERLPAPESLPSEIPPTWPLDRAREGQFFAAATEKNTPYKGKPFLSLNTDVIVDPVLRTRAENIAEQAAKALADGKLTSVDKLTLPVELEPYRANIGSLAEGLEAGNRIALEQVQNARRSARLQKDTLPGGVLPDGVAPAPWNPDIIVQVGRGGTVEAVATLRRDPFGVPSLEFVGKDPRLPVSAGPLQTWLNENGVKRGNLLMPGGRLARRRQIDRGGPEYAVVTDDVGSLASARSAGVPPSSLGLERPPGPVGPTGDELAAADAAGRPPLIEPLDPAADPLPPPTPGVAAPGVDLPGGWAVEGTPNGVFELSGPDGSPQGVFASAEKAALWARERSSTPARPPLYKVGQEVPGGVVLELDEYGLPLHVGKPPSGLTAEQLAAAQQAKPSPTAQSIAADFAPSPDPQPQSPFPDPVAEAGMVNVGVIVSETVPRAKEVLDSATAFLKTNLGRKSERYEAAYGKARGKALADAERVHHIVTEGLGAEQTNWLAERLADSDMFTLLEKLPFGKRGAARMTSIGRNYLPKKWAEHFGIPAAEQATLFDAVEAIKDLDSNGLPVFGTKERIPMPEGKIFKLPGSDLYFVHEVVPRKGTGPTNRVVAVDPKLKVELDPMTGQMAMRDRFTAAEGRALWDKLSPKAREIALWGVQERELFRQRFNIESSIEGYAPHYFPEGGIVGGMKRLLFKTRKAQERKFRTGEEGYVRNFEEAFGRYFSSIRKEGLYNSFIKDFAQRATDPVDPVLGPKPGWRVIEATQPARGGVIVGQLAGKRQVPAEFYKDFIQMVERAEEIGTGTKVINTAARYLQSNLLLSPGTAVRNAAGNGVLVGTKFMHNFYEDMARGNWQQTAKNFRSVFAALTPHALQELPPYMLGQKGTIATGGITGAASHPVLTAYDLALFPLQAVDNYFRRVIALSEIKGPVTRQHLLGAGAREFAKALDATDRWASTYDNTTKWVEKFRKTRGAAFFIPFVSYPYNLMRTYGSYLAAFNPLVEMTSQDRFARMATLGTVMGTLSYLANKDNPRVGKYLRDMPLSTDASGRIKIGEGKTKDEERYLDVMPYPWGSLYMATVQGADISNSLLAVGPGLDLSIMMLPGEYTSKYERREDIPTRLGKRAKLFVPGSRIIEALPKLRGEERAYPENFMQAAGLEEKTAKSYLRGTKIARKYDPDEEWWKFWLGVNMRTIKLQEYQAAYRRQSAVQKLPKEEQPIFRRSTLPQWIGRRAKQLGVLTEEDYKKFVERP